MHNVEKSAFQKGQYVGYGGGAVWHIRNYGKGNWKATPQGNNKHQVFSCATLRDVSTQLETLSAKPMDANLTSARKANPATRKRAISRPSQVTKKAPTKRLVARRKAAAKKPVKGYFPNPNPKRSGIAKPEKITIPGPSKPEQDEMPHLFPQPGGAYMISFWRENTRKWVPATLAYSMNEARKWLEYQGYTKAILLK